MWSLLFIAAAQADTLTVCAASGVCDYQQLDAAINRTDAGDVLELRDETYEVKSVITKDLTIKGIEGTVLSCSTGSGALIEVTGNANVRIEGVSVVPCSNESAFRVKASPDGRVDLVGISATDQTWSMQDGGLLHLEDGAFVVLDDVHISDITTSGNAGIISVLSATSGGPSASLEIYRSSFTALSGAVVGQVVNSGNSQVLLDEVLLDNASSVQGSGVTVFNQLGFLPKPSLTITASTFKNNVGKNGGALAITGGEIDLTDNLFEDNRASAAGGAMYIERLAELKLENNRFYRNTSGAHGGAVFATQLLELSSMGEVYCDNQSTQTGGGLYLLASNTLTHFEVTRGIFWRNDARTGGGGIMMSSLHQGKDAQPGIAFSTFVDNQSNSGGQQIQIMKMRTRMRLSAVRSEGNTVRVHSTTDATIVLDDNVWSDTDGVNVGGITPGVGQTDTETNDLAFTGPLDAACEDAHLALFPQPGSVMVDKATDVNDVDPDGSPADAGALYFDQADSDGDGVIGAQDCDDDDNTSYPGAPEQCDDIDHDCNGDPGTAADGQPPAGAVDAWVDSDGDRFGDPDNASGLFGVCPSSVPDEGYVLQSVQGAPDCDDADPAINPDAVEQCDDIDHDCNDGPQNDVPDAPIWWPDTDKDGEGAQAGGVQSCDAPSTGTWVTETGDCDDEDPERFSGNPELCDDIDHNCDAEPTLNATDEPTWLKDSDGDDFAPDGADEVVACEAPSGFVASTGDCNDGDATIHPDADELCDSTDHDCDGDDTAGAVDQTEWHIDADQDGHGSADQTVVSCAPPTTGQWQPGPGDCDDGDPTNFPGNTEVCDAKDNNCDNTIDEDGVCDPTDSGDTDSGDTDSGDTDSGDTDTDDTADPSDTAGTDDSAVPVTDDRLLIVGGGCSSSGGGATWLGLVALLALRRRATAIPQLERQCSRSPND